MNWEWYRQRPTVIQAFRWEPHLAGEWDAETMKWENTPDGCAGTPLNNNLVVGTTQMARPGDWVVKGVDGKLRVCKDGEFQDTYKEVE